MRCEQQSDGGPCRRVSSTPPLLPMCNGCSTTKSKFIACGAAVGVCQHQCGVKYWRSPSLREQPQKLCLKDYALRLSRFGSPGTIRTNTWDLAERGALLLQPSGADRRSVYVSRHTRWLRSSTQKSHGYPTLFHGAKPIAAEKRPRGESSDERPRSTFQTKSVQRVIPPAT